MANRFSRGPQVQPQFQETSLETLYKPAMMAQQRADQNRAMISQESARVADMIVRTEDEDHKNQLLDKFKKDTGDIINNYGGDIAAASRDLWSSISSSRSTGDYAQMLENKKQYDINRKVQIELEAKGIPYYDYGQSQGVATYNPDGTRNDVRFNTVGFEKDYTGHIEKFVDNYKSSAFGQTFSNIAKEMGVEDPTLSQILVYKKTHGIKFSNKEREAIKTAYRDSGYGKSQYERYRMADQMEDDLAIDAIDREVDRAITEREFWDFDPKLMDRRPKGSGSKPESPNNVYNQSLPGTDKIKYDGDPEILKQEARDGNEIAQTTLNAKKDDWALANPEKAAKIQASEELIGELKIPNGIHDKELLAEMIISGITPSGRPIDGNMGFQLVNSYIRQHDPNIPKANDIQQRKDLGQRVSTEETEWLKNYRVEEKKINEYIMGVVDGSNTEVKNALEEADIDMAEIREISGERDQFISDELKTIEQEIAYFPNKDTKNRSNLEENVRQSVLLNPYGFSFEEGNVAGDAVAEEGFKMENVVGIGGVTKDKKVILLYRPEDSEQAYPLYTTEKNPNPNSAFSEYADAVDFGLGQNIDDEQEATKMFEDGNNAMGYFSASNQERYKNSSLRYIDGSGYYLDDERITVKDVLNTLNDVEGPEAAMALSKIAQYYGTKNDDGSFNIRNVSSTLDPKANGASFKAAGKLILDAYLKYKK